MSDSQWPRFQVFLQEREGAPHQDVGSVHAPDVELALLNARDVFLRRPDGVNLWVAPADAVFTKTAEELQDKEAGMEAPGVNTVPVEDGRRTSERDGQPSQSFPETYYVFNKQKPAGTLTYAGKITAASPTQALVNARETFSYRTLPFVWAVIPARLVVSTGPEDFESMFAPAKDKTFRMPADFHTLSAMREIRAQTQSIHRDNEPKEVDQP